MEERGTLASRVSILAVKTLSRPSNVVPIGLHRLLLTIVDEYTQEGMAVKVARGLNPRHMLATPARLLLFKGVPEYT